VGRHRESSRTVAQVMSKAKTPEKSTTESKSKAARGSAASKTPASSAKKASSTASSKSTTSTTAARKAAPQRSTATAKTAKKAAGTKAAAGMSKTHARLHKKMQEERGKLVRQAEDIAAEQAALAADPDAAEISSDLESGDCVASREREVDLRLAAHIQETIDQIDRAEERLLDGSYGDCTRCHAKIPAARLEALPYAELCVSCQQQHERLYY